MLVLNYCQPCNAIEQLSRSATKLAGGTVNAGRGISSGFGWPVSAFSCDHMLCLATVVP